jgi:hypothetical protein
VFARAALCGPRVTVDATGDAVVVWTVTYSEFSEVVQASIRLGSTGTWAPPVQISPAGEWGELAEVAFDDAGNLTAVWANITHHQVQASTYSTSSQAWSEPQTISTGEMRSGPLLAVAPNGRAVVAWSVDVGNGNNVVRASVRPSRAGAWLSEHDLSAPDGYAAVDDMATDPSGQTIVMWDRFLATTDYIEVATLPAGSQEWSPAEALNRAGTSGHNGQVAFDGEGNAVAAWLRDIQLEHDGIDVSVRAAGDDGWSPAQPIAEHIQGPALTVDASGDAVVVYGEVNWYTTIKSRVRDARSGLWGLPSKLAPRVIEAYPLTIESGALGGAFALWQLHSDQCYCFTLQGADYIGRTH